MLLNRALSLLFHSPHIHGSPSSVWNGEARQFKLGTQIEYSEC